MGTRNVYFVDEVGNLGYLSKTGDWYPREVVKGTFRCWLGGNGIYVDTAYTPPTTKMQAYDVIDGIQGWLVARCSPFNNYIVKTANFALVRNLAFIEKASVVAQDYDLIVAPQAIDRSDTYRINNWTWLKPTRMIQFDRMIEGEEVRALYADLDRQFLLWQVDHMTGVKGAVRAWLDATTDEDREAIATEVERQLTFVQDSRPENKLYEAVSTWRFYARLLKNRRISWSDVQKYHGGSVKSYFAYAQEMHDTNLATIKRIIN